MDSSQRLLTAWRRLVLPALAAAAVWTAALVAKSLLDYSHTGPAVREAVAAHFAGYVVYALARLALWALAVSAWLAALGVIVWWCLCRCGGRVPHFAGAFAAGLAAIALGTLYQFLWQLLYLPGGIVASWLYRVSRLYPLWELLTPARLAVLGWLLAGAVVLPFVIALVRLLRARRTEAAAALTAAAALLAAPLMPWPARPLPAAGGVHAAPASRPNIVLIGSDTLRADRLSALGYPRPTTPFIDRLARRGVLFSHCYVPIARTAPSLLSMLTGTWPQRHGIETNFSAPEDYRAGTPALPALLAAAGYRSEALTDWAGADLGKYPLGFTRYDGPADQWNLKYLLRQGPKDLRLFLTLFLHNDLGRVLLPEVYYLAGVPMGPQILARTRRVLARLAAGGKPFALTVFASSTHLPFASEYPYYRLFADPRYRGESRFAMSGLGDPDAIVRRQAQDEHAFDVQQVIDLYDGAVRSFDALVAGVYRELERLGLAEHTIVVVYSDHGVDLFERHTWGQGNTVLGEEPSARVPLLVVDPRRPGGTIVDRVVRNVDLAPTLLALSGLPVPEGIQGRSLVPYLDDPEAELGLTAFHETGVWLAPVPGLAKRHLRYPPITRILDIPDRRTGTLVIAPRWRDRVLEARDRMVRTERWKLVYLPMTDGARYWLFDVARDPRSTTDVAARHPEVVAALRARLIDWLLLDPTRAWRGEHVVPRDAGHRETGRG